MLSLRVFWCAAALMVFPAAAFGVPTIITFEGLAHGEVVDTDFAGQGLVSITTTNIGGGPDLGIIFDTNETGTSDPDLEDPWSGGNISGVDLSNILIIQENSVGCGDDVCDDPDDEGTRPAGSFEFLFNTPLAFFGFDLIDVDGTGVEDGSVIFHDGFSTFTIDWSDFEAGGSFDSFAPGLAFGNNTANRISVITAGDVGLTKFDKIVIEMAGSGGIDNLVIPEPSTALLVALGCLGLVAAARRIA